MNRGEIPDGANSAFDEAVAYFLCAGSGNGDDADMNIHSAAHGLKLVNGKYGLALKFNRFLAQVERRKDIKPVSLETAVVKQRLAKAAGADDNRIINIVIAEERFKLSHQILDIIADLRLAGRADARQILSDLNIVELKCFGYHCCGYIFRCIRRKSLYIAEI